MVFQSSSIADFGFQFADTLMGRKKPTALDDDTAATVHGGMQMSEKTQVQENIVVMTSKKKGNSKASQFKVEDDDDDVVSKIVITGKKKKKKSKSKKGGSSNAFTASNFGLLEEEGEDGGDDDDDESALTGEKDDDKEDSLPIIFAGKKQSKSLKKGGFSVASTFDALDYENDEDAIDNEIVAEEDISDEPNIAFAGKKSSKSCKKNGTIFTVTGFSGFDNEDEDGDVHKDVEDVDITLICFSDKKKKSFKASKKIRNSFSAAFVDEENDGDVYISEPDKLDDEGIDDEDTSFIAFSSKKKASKMKSSFNSTKLRDESGLRSEVRDAVVLETLYIGTSTFDSDTTKVIRTEGVAETSKKKKKSGRTAQEDDDLDKILAELGEGPPISKPFVPSHLFSQEDKVEKPPELVAPIDASAEKKAEEESKESAAARKKKKKEKEKEKKAAAAAVAEVNDEKIDEVKTEKIEPKKGAAKSKMPEKKVPKHVRDIQEAMAKRKDEEERRKREEEERLRKDEEGRLMQEELERQAEEAKRRKKEREKEKLLRKKQEGKLLTGKQKEVKRRLESMRNRILTNAGGSPQITSDPSGPAKRPIYQTKKTPPGHHQATGSVQAKLVEHIEEKTQENVVEKTKSLESEKIEAVELLHEEEKPDVIEVIEDDEDDEIKEDEDEWDANSWDDVVFDLSLKSACADAEFDSEPEIVMKNDRKNSAPTLWDEGAKPACLAQKTLPPQPVKSPDIENKRNQDGVEVVDKDKRKDNAVKKKTLDATLKPEENLRSPICCIMGHVDAGKTKLLDCIRGTNVQEGEARGITQQIGATYFPAENIRERTRELKSAEKLKFLDLLVIDTPGHESFTNLRSRGSGLCDIAILVVDIMHGLEPQTIESLELLRMRNTEFIVALNKVDRLYGWKTNRNAPILKTWKQQSKDVQNEFNIRLSQIITEFKEQGLNTGLYDKKKEMGESWETSYIVPTSAVTGEGIPDLLLLVGLWAQKNMTEKLMYSDEVQCTVLEVKVVEGHGTTIDVILVNGVLHEGDQIVVCGMQGPIVTTIRALLTPHPMKELRVKGTYLHHKEIKAAQGIKITGQGLEHAISGTGLYVVGPDDNLDAIKDLVMEDMKSVLSRIDKSGEGVCVQASTIGSLEALLAFLKSPAVNIPISGISIGPVHEKDVKKASVMLEKKKEYAVILAFDVKVTPKARELADELGVKIFIADVIYHLFDQFKAYIHTLKEEKKKEAAEEVVFPCVLKILPNFIFKKKNPILLGVDVIEGIAKVGTPICIPQREFIDIGRIASIKINDKPVDCAKKGQQIAIKITGHSPEEQQKLYGKHFDSNDELVSHISRKSIDVLKTNYRDDLSKDEWRLLVKLKILFKIQ